MIKVTNIPDGTSKDALLFFFENRRKSGGGSVEDLEYDPDTKSAVITFEEPEGKISLLNHMILIYMLYRNTLLEALRGSDKRKTFLWLTYIKILLSACDKTCRKDFM